MPHKNNISIVNTGKNISSFSVIIIAACLLLLGFIISPKLSVKLNPSKNYPEINVSFNMWGQSAGVIEREVTSRLEAMLSRIKGVEEVNSYSSSGAGNINLKLSEHANPAVARFEVAAVIRQAWPSMPLEASYPSVYMSGATENVKLPFLRYTINAPVSPLILQEYVENNIKTKLSGINHVSRVDLSGANRMMYKLHYDIMQLHTYNVTVEDITFAIQQYLNKEFLGLGKIKDQNGQAQWIRIALNQDNNDISFNPHVIPVKNKDDKIIYLNQLVTVSFEEEDALSYFRINGLNSVYMSVGAEEDANQLVLSKQIQQLMQKIQHTLPPGYEFHLSYDASEYIQAELKKIYFRVGLTLFILFCFLLFVYRNMRYFFLVIFSMTTNLAIASVFYYTMHVELQVFSLAGLTISLTLIIDNIVIMADQVIHQKNKRAFRAILAATITTIGALLMIFFIDKDLRLNLIDFAWVVIINLAISVFVALFLVPALIEKLNISKIHKNSYPLKRRCKRLLAFNSIYERIIVGMFKKRAWFIFVLVLSFGIPVFLLPEKIEGVAQENYFSFKEEAPPSFWVNLYNNTFGSEFYRESIKPISDKTLGGASRLFAQSVRKGTYSSGEKAETSLNLTTSLPNGATIHHMNSLVKKMEDYIKQYPQVKQFETDIQNERRAAIRIFLTKKYQRGAFPYTLKSKLIEKAIELGGGGNWEVYGLGDGFSNDIAEKAGSSRIKIVGYNYADLTAMANTLKDSLQQYSRVRNMTIDSRFSWYKDDYSEFAFKLDKEYLAHTNLTPAELLNYTSGLLNKKSYVGEWVNSKRMEPIVLSSATANTMDIWNLNNYPVGNDEKLTKLGNVATLVKSQVPKDIAKESQQYRLCLQYEYIGDDQQAWNFTEKAIKMFNKTAPLGYKAENVSMGNWWKEGTYAKYMPLLFIMLIIFFTTGILFNSLRQPLVVMAIIPVSFIGIFLTFYFFDLSFDQGGFAAFILLAGISVNASIYILNEYNNIRTIHPGLTPLKGYMKAWNAKIRPISLTIVATILGFLPFIIGEYREPFWFPLAAGIIGGLIFTIITLFVFLPLFMCVGKPASASPPQCAPPGEMPVTRHTV